MSGLSGRKEGYARSAFALQPPESKQPEYKPIKSGNFSLSGLSEPQVARLKPMNAAESGDQMSLFDFEAVEGEIAEVRIERRGGMAAEVSRLVFRAACRYSGKVDASLHQQFYYPPGILTEKKPAPRGVPPATS